MQTTIAPFREPNLPFLLLFLLFGSAAGQFASPKREVRAVWLTTAAGLDWPRTDRQGFAAEFAPDDRPRPSLRHFNTIFFQVRARADAYYHSASNPGRRH